MLCSPPPHDALVGRDVIVPAVIPCGECHLCRSGHDTACLNQIMPGNHVHGGFARPPKPLSPEAEALFGLVKQAGTDLGQTIGWQPSGGVCDGNNIAACGVPVVDTMGVRGGKIHSMEEYLIVDSLAERAALSALTILRLAGGAR